MVIGAVHALCEFSLLVSQQHHYNQSLNTIDDTLKQFFLKMGGFVEQTMLMSAMTKVDKLLARIFPELEVQRSFEIHAPREVRVYEDEKFTPTK